MTDTTQFRSLSPTLSTVAEGLPSLRISVTDSSGTASGIRGSFNPDSFDFGGWTAPEGGFGGWTAPEGGFGSGWTAPISGSGWTAPEGGFGGWTAPEGGFGGWTAPEGGFGGWTAPEGGFGGGGWTPPEGGFGSGWTPPADLEETIEETIDQTIEETLAALEPILVTIMVDGIPRTFGIILPADFDPDQTYSAIMTFHGGGGVLNDPASMASLTGFSGYGDPAQFIEIYPIAEGETWSWDPNTAEYDDIAYVEAVVDEVVANYNVDPDQIYAAGISGGGMFVQSLALEVPDLFNGYAVVAANMMEVLEAEAVAATSDTPIVIFHGTEDPGQPYNGIQGWNGGTIMYGVEESADFWADRNGTEMGEFVALPDTVDDGMTVMVATSLDGTVQHYVIEGGGHTWPGSVPDSAQDISASDLMVEFFQDFGF